MTNYEKYKNDIEKFTRLNITFALDKDTKEIVKCAGFNCNGCAFYNSIEYCDDDKLKWADDEYIEEVDWSKVAVDTPILVSDNKVDWSPRYFAKYENGEIYSFYNGQTSWSSGNKYSSSWDYAKLAEVE